MASLGLAGEIELSIDQLLHLGNEPVDAAGKNMSENFTPQQTAVIDREKWTLQRIQLVM